MSHRRIASPAFAMALLLLVTAPACAGPYSDALGKCMVASTTTAQKATLVRWLFAMMALHPDVQSVSAVSPEQRTALSKDMAQIVQRLLTESCTSEARDAVRYEGPSTMEASFSLLGQVAARELFANPKVTEGTTEFAKYIDEKKLKEVLGPEKK